MSFIMFIVATILVATFFVVSLIFTPIYFIFSGQWGLGLIRFNRYWWQLAISVDQFGNGSCGRFLESVLIKRSERSKAYEFGNVDETVSFVLAINNRRNVLNGIGKFIAALLDWLDKDHLEKAVLVQMDHDKRGCERLNSDFYVKLAP